MSEGGKTSPLFVFAFHGEKNAECKTIQSVIIEEPWGKDLMDLKIYLRNNFEIAKKNNKIYEGEEKAVWRPGHLINEDGDEIWLTYCKNPIKGKQPWKFDRVVSECPVEVEAKNLKIEYTPPEFESSRIIDINYGHIDDENRGRLKKVLDIPIDEKFKPYIRDKIRREIKLEKKLDTVIPQWYKEGYQFLIPLCLKSPNNVDLVAALQPKGKKYYVRTLLYPNQAYANARSVVKSRLKLPHWIVENENIEENKVDKTTIEKTS